MEKNERSCIDCGVANCDDGDKSFPDFCVSKRIKKETLEKVIELYKEDENSAVAIASAEVENDFYCKIPRVEEVIQFAEKMHFNKLGIATCVGLIRESRILAKILRNRGFEVFGIACKAGVTAKTSINIPERCAEVGVNMCNPILQAELLNQQNTDLNIVMGLCVGHDSLFYKYSDSLVTTLVCKDRVMGHNPIAALYTAHSYYGKLMKKSDKQ